MDSLELAQRHYLHEAERQSSLNQSVSVPLALLTALLTGTISMLTQARQFHWAEAALVGLCMCAILVLMTAITNLVRASVGYRYALPPTVADQFEWRDGLIANGRSRFAAEQEFLAVMEKEYAECAKINFANNNRKAIYLEVARTRIVATVCILAVAGVPYLVIKGETPVPTAQSNLIADEGKSK
jgi:hypothetical protein